MIKVTFAGVEVEQPVKVKAAKKSSAKGGSKVKVSKMAEDAVINAGIMEHDAVVRLLRRAVVAKVWDKATYNRCFDPSNEDVEGEKKLADECAVICDYSDDCYRAQRIALTFFDEFCLRLGRPQVQFFGRGRQDVLLEWPDGSYITASRAKY